MNEEYDGEGSRSGKIRMKMKMSMLPNLNQSRGYSVQEVREERRPRGQYGLLRVNGLVFQYARGFRDLVPLFVGGASQAA